MTSMHKKRCNHCGTGYVFTASGNGCGRWDNDDRLCPECVAVTKRALTDLVPKKFEVRYRSITDARLARSDGARFNVTLDQLLSWEKQRAAEPGLSVQRIWPGLIDTPSGDIQNIREVRDPDTHQPFRLSTWQRRDEVTIEVPMIYDLINDRWTNELA